MVKQSQAVHDLTLKHNNIHAARWRELQVALAQQPLPRLSQAVEALDNVEADLVALQRQTAQPLPVRRQWDHPGYRPILLHYRHLRPGGSTLAFRPHSRLYWPENWLGFHRFWGALEELAWQRTSMSSTPPSHC